mgnify:CR=1 FL=1
MVAGLPKGEGEKVNQVINNSTLARVLECLRKDIKDPMLNWAERNELHQVIHNLEKLLK